MTAADDVRTLQLPLSEADARSLRAGDRVLLNGLVTITIGLPTHQRMLDCVQRGEPLPIDLRGGAFLHLSSFNRETDGKFEALYLNPSTSTRYNAWMPGLIRGLGLRVVGGKGGLDSASVAAMRDTGCVYLSFLGGGCTLLSRALREVHSVHWNDYISQFRLVTLRVAGLGPATVAIDAHGNSLYDSLRQAALQRLPSLMQSLKD